VSHVLWPRSVLVPVPSPPFAIVKINVAVVLLVTLDVATAIAATAAVVDDVVVFCR
jgi:hypothetical protein